MAWVQSRPAGVDASAGFLVGAHHSSSVFIIPIINPVSSDWLALTKDFLWVYLKHYGRPWPTAQASRRPQNGKHENPPHSGGERGNHAHRRVRQREASNLGARCSLTGRQTTGIAERGGYDPNRAVRGPLRQIIRLLRHQDAGHSPGNWMAWPTAVAKEHEDGLQGWPCRQRTSAPLFARLVAGQSRGFGLLTPPMTPEGHYYRSARS